MPNRNWVTQFVVSGTYFNMNFLLLIIQSIVCVSCVVIAKHFKVYITVFNGSTRFVAQTGYRTLAFDLPRF